jgi:hypothetical protein
MLLRACPGRKAADVGRKLLAVFFFFLPGAPAASASGRSPPLGRPRPAPPRPAGSGGRGGGRAGTSPPLFAKAEEGEAAEKKKRRTAGWLSRRFVALAYANDSD